MIIENPLIKELFALQDKEYRDFTAKLIPNVDKEKIIGIRVPILRKFAKEFYKDKLAVEDFFSALPHHYYEENLLHSFLIEQIKDFQSAVEYTETFLPFVDNWAVCDTFSPKIFQKHPKEVYEYILKWIKSDKTYTIRYAVGLLLSIYLDEHFQKEMLQLVSEVKSEEYYVNMMLAWYFATALAKQYEATVPLIEAKTLPPFVQNKTIQKARESRRISTETKEYLLKFKL